MAASRNEQRPSISEEDYQKILAWNSTPLHEWKTCIHNVIRGQATSQPDAEAICSEEDGSLSYSELDQLSSRLAGHLVELRHQSGTTSGEPILRS
jgi:non-ribosomal peptide synthetase component F